MVLERPYPLLLPLDKMPKCVYYHSGSSNGKSFVRHFGTELADIEK